MLDTATIDRAIRQTAGKLASPGSGGFSVDDLAQIAWEALLAKGMPEDIRLVVTIAKRRMIDAIRGDSIRRCHSLDYQAEDGRTVLDTLKATPVYVPAEDPRLGALADFVASVTDPREADLLSCNLLAEGKRESIESIGARHGVSKQRMSQIMKGLKARIKVALG